MRCMFARGGWASAKGSGAAASILCEGPAAPGRRLLEVVCETIRARHMSRRTAETYIGWISRHVLFHGERHRRDLGPGDIGRFLSRPTRHCTCPPWASGGFSAPALGRRGSFTHRGRSAAIR